jgi:hypothetical protein
MREDRDLDIGLDYRQFNVERRNFIGDAVAVAFDCPLRRAVDA